MSGFELLNALVRLAESDIERHGLFLQLGCVRLCLAIFKKKTNDRLRGEVDYSRQLLLQLSNGTQGVETDFGGF